MRKMGMGERNKLRSSGKSWWLSGTQGAMDGNEQTSKESLSKDALVAILFLCEWQKIQDNRGFNNRISFLSHLEVWAGGLGLVWCSIYLLFFSIDLMLQKASTCIVGKRMEKEMKHTHTEKWHISAIFFGRFLEQFYHSLLTPEPLIGGSQRL